MASRLGVIAFNDAAAKEHLKNGVSGFISNLDNDEAFIQSVFHAIEHPTELASIRENAYQLAQSITWDSIVDQFMYKLLEKPSLSLEDCAYESTQNI